MALIIAFIALLAQTHALQLKPLKPSGYWCLKAPEYSQCVAEIRASTFGLNPMDGYRGFVFGGRTSRPCLIRSLSFKEGGFGGIIWESSIGLGAHLHRNPWLVRGKRCVELGSGCGLGGLAALAAGATEVTLTDTGLDLGGEGEGERSGTVGDGEAAAAVAYAEAYEAARSSDKIVPLELLANLRKTASLNLDIWQTAPLHDDDTADANTGAGTDGAVGALKVQRLEWYDEHEGQGGEGREAERDQEREQAVDVILGADLVYYPEDIPPLIDTICRFLKKGGGRRNAPPPLLSSPSSSSAAVSSFSSNSSGSAEGARASVGGGGGEKGEGMHQEGPVAVLMLPGPRDGDPQFRGTALVPDFIVALKSRGQVTEQAYFLTNYETSALRLITFRPF